MQSKYVFLQFILYLQALIGVSGQGKSVGIPTDETCPLLYGIYGSVMRRIFNPVEETIPRGAYVDPDELRDLQFKTGLSTYIPSTVDVEKPEFESEAFRVFIFRNLEVQENLRVTKIMLPIRMRYHRPTSPLKKGDQPTAIVKIQNPRIMLNCENEDITDNCTGRVVTGYCRQFDTKCQYINLPYKINVASLEVGVPVGNSEDASLVVAVTTLLTSGATIYLLTAIFRPNKVKKD